MRTALVLGVILALAVSTPVDAKPKPQMSFDFAVLVARDYWAHRGVKVPCAPQPHPLTWRQTASWNYAVDMIAEPDTCSIEIAPWANIRADQLDRRNYCWNITHEVGHLAGLQHPDAPAAANLPAAIRAMLPNTVMNTEGATYPYGCKHPKKFLRRSPYALTRSGF